MDANPQPAVKPAQPVTEYKRKGIRLGWTIRLANGKLAKVTWIENGQMMAKVIQQ